MLLSPLISLIFMAVLIVQLVAFVDCLLRPQQAFIVAEKLTKPGWLLLTGLAVVVSVLFGRLSMLGLAGIVASIVYLVDVRPAVRTVGRGGSRGRWG